MKYDLDLPSLEESAAFLASLLREDDEGRVMTFVEDPSCWWYLVTIERALQAGASTPDGGEA